MKNLEVRQAVQAFLGLLDGQTPVDEQVLVAALDRLACAMATVTFTFDERDFPAPPRRNYSELRNAVEARFPELGAYNRVAAVTAELGVSPCLVADAVDDIVDIAIDLAEVEWRWVHTSEDDALWELDHSFRTHWGDHLRSCQLYLHAKANGW